MDAYASYPCCYKDDSIYDLQMIATTPKDFVRLARECFVTILITINADLQFAASVNIDKLEIYMFMLISSTIVLFHPVIIVNFYFLVVSHH